MSNWEKEYTFIKGFAHANGYTQLMIAMSYAKRKHEGQFRRATDENGNKIPYISHPVKVTAHLITLGIVDEDTLVVSMLHDVKEDTDSTFGEMRKVGISEKNIRSIFALTKQGKLDDEDTSKYFSDIFDNGIEAILAKLGDRCHNVSTMFGAFDKEKMRFYVLETKIYFFPMMKRAKEEYPQYSNQIVAMRYHIQSILDILEAYYKS